MRTLGQQRRTRTTALLAMTLMASVLPVAGWATPSAGAAVTAPSPPATAAAAAPLAPASSVLRGRVAQALGDLDGDGRDDLIRAELEPGTTNPAAVAFFGRADGGSDRVVVAMAGDPVAGLAVVAIDHDGDGSDELLWFDPAGLRASVLWQLSGTRQWSGRSLPAPPSGSTPVVLDITGDGRQDVLWHGGAVGDVLARASANGFDLEHFWPEGGLDPFPGDFDGDAAEDVIWYDDVTGRGVLWWGGRVISAAPFDIGTGSTLRVGQFDGVGGEDLLVSGPNGFVELDGSSSRRFSPSVVPAWVAAGSAVGDVNGDRRSDVVVVGGPDQPHAHGFWNNDSGGWLWEPWPWSEVGNAGRISLDSFSGRGLPPAVLLLGDLNGDDMDEVLLADSTTMDQGPTAGLWQPGYRREAIYRHPNPWAAPEGLVVRTLGITAGRPVDPPLRSVTDGCGASWPVHAAIADLAQRLLSAAASDGLALCVNFGYRSYAQQAALRERRCAEAGYPANTACIYSWASGSWPFDGADQIQRPGYSRHQLGVALDIGDIEGYATATVTAWLSANAHRYGFYNLGDRRRLGPGFAWGSGGEPWHVSLDGR